MEGQNGCNNSVRMLSLDFGANVNIVSQVPRDFTNHHHVLPADRNVNQTNIPHLTEWTQAAKTSPAFVEFIAETSSFSRKTSTKDVIAVVPSTVQTINGVSELRGKISYNHLAGSYNSKSTDSRVSQSMSSLTYLQSCGCHCAEVNNRSFKYKDIGIYHLKFFAFNFGHNVC